MREDDRNAAYVVAGAVLIIYLIAPSMLLNGLAQAADTIASSIRFVSDSVANTGLIGGSTCGSYRENPGADPAGQGGCQDYSSIKIN